VPELEQRALSNLSFSLLDKHKACWEKPNLQQQHKGPLLKIFETGTCFAGLELEIFLPPLKCWDYRHAWLVK
jgi:hypothetical protein